MGGASGEILPPFGKIRTPFGKILPPFEKIRTLFGKILPPFGDTDYAGLVQGFAQSVLPAT
jgi:hypothetical protein